jgi:hypothetical protein
VAGAAARATVASTCELLVEHTFRRCISHLVEREARSCSYLAPPSRRSAVLVAPWSR